jgi:UDP-N-acetylmuramate--alanine ligase
LVDEGSVESILDKLVLDGDVILMQGAGSISQLANHLMQE